MDIAANQTTDDALAMRAPIAPTRAAWYRRLGHVVDLRKDEKRPVIVFE